jgi:predicted ArsR family transcriptional regulator
MNDAQLSLPLARRADPDTSHAAADRVAEFSGAHHNAILAALRIGPATVYELAERTGIAAHAIGKRMHELSKAGRVSDSGHRRASPSGRGCIVWKVTT